MSLHLLREALVIHVTCSIGRRTRPDRLDNPAHHLESADANQQDEDDLWPSLRPHLPGDFDIGDISRDLIESDRDGNDEGIRTEIAEPLEEGYGSAGAGAPMHRLTGHRVTRHG